MMMERPRFCSQAKMAIYDTPGSLDALLASNMDIEPRSLMEETVWLLSRFLSFVWDREHLIDAQ